MGAGLDSFTEPLYFSSLFIKKVRYKETQRKLSSQRPVQFIWTVILIIAIYSSSQRKRLEQEISSYADTNDKIKLKSLIMAQIERWRQA